jgi:hypothetical protein
MGVTLRDVCSRVRIHADHTELDCELVGTFLLTPVSQPCPDQVTHDGSLRLTFLGTEGAQAGFELGIEAYDKRHGVSRV